MGTGKIQFQPVRNGGQLLRDRDKFLNRAAENRDEQKPIVGHSQAGKTFKRFVHPWIGQADGIHEATRRELTVDRLAITCARLHTNTFSGDHADLRHGIDHPLNNGWGGRHNARGDSERS